MKTSSVCLSPVELHRWSDCPNGLKILLRSGRGLQNNPTDIPVVGLALIDEQGRVLMQQRRAGARHARLWEFPGGKVEAGESSEGALVREIAEELGIVVSAEDLRFAAMSRGESEPYVLTLYTAIRWQGEPRCLDAQAIAWVTPSEAAMLAVPPLDVPLVAALPEFLRAAREPAG
jgi:8-oxo-dGTP diphosphatase